jgi:3-oxoacyl-[acyl-carrier protein] reductase
MDLGLRDKVAVVLASSAGLGLASATALAAEGARVAISGRDEKRLDAARMELEREHPGRVLAERVDVIDSNATRAHLERVRERWGAVHVLVTNAGGPKPGAAAELGDDDLQRAFDLTLRSSVAAIRVVLPWMRAQRWGRIVALTSSSVRAPIAGLALSNTFRAGLTGYLKTLASEVARDGVLVNSICTGMFDTDRLRELFAARAAKSGRTLDEERAAVERDIPLGRIGRVEEFAALVAFLASERASFVTGAALPIDGGASRSLL